MVSPVLGRWSSTVDSTPLMLELTEHADGVETEPGNRVVYDLAREEAHFGAARVDGHAIVWELSRRSRAGRLAAPLRSRRLPARGVAYRTRPPGPRRPAPALRRADDRVSGRDAHVPRRRVVARGRRPPGARVGLVHRRHGLRARPAAARRVGREAHDPLPRRRRRGEAELQRATILLEQTVRAMMRSGGKALVDQLELHGAELAFCVPGESYLPVLDAFRDSPIRLISCRHEGCGCEHGRGVRQAHRPAGDLLRHARPGRDPRVRRRAHRRPGLDAADPLRRPGASRSCRP